MKGLLADYLIKSSYDIDPDIMRKLYKCMLLIQDKSTVNNPLNLLLATVNRILRLQTNVPKTSYHKNNRLLLVVDEIYLRLSNSNNEQIKLFLDGELSLYNLGKTSSEINIISFDKCISCDGELNFNPLIKKYNCNTCYCEYQA
jgi:hypothetical protein